MLPTLVTVSVDTPLKGERAVCLTCEDLMLVGHAQVLKFTHSLVCGTF